MSETLTETSPNGKKIIPLDDVRAEFESFVNTNLYGENDSILSDSVGKISDESDLNELEETMYTLENSIDSLAPKVPIINENKFENIKIAAKKKLAKKSVREELKDIKFNNNPELANLENTIVLNSEVLKQGLVNTEKKRDEEKSNHLGIVAIVILFVVLVLFTLAIPFIINYL